MNQRFSDIILEHYIMGEHRLHERPIFISVGFESAYFAYANTITAKRSVILTVDVKRIHWVIERFGHVFSRISFDVISFGDTESQICFNYVDKHCRNATKQILIRSVDNKALGNWTLSFDRNTTEVISRPYLDKPLPFSKLFPYVQKLTLTNLLKEDVQHYPHLIKCSMQSTRADASDPNVYELIRLNPQLRHIYTTMRYNASYLNYLNEMLPSLESLGVEMIAPSAVEPDGQVIRFKNVKEFTFTLVNLDGDYRQAIGNIKFDQLERFKLEKIFGTVNFNDDLSEIISENRHLRVFESQVEMTFEQVIGLIEGLPELKEISINWSRVTNTLLEALLSENHGLNIINVANPINNAEVWAIAETIPPAWRLTGYEAPYTSFSITRNKPETD